MKYTEQQIKEIISNLIIKNVHTYGTILRHQYPDIIDFLKKKYLLLNGHSLAEYCYWFLNDLNNFPNCKNNNCSNTTKFRGITVGYQSFCSSKCSANNENTRSLFKKTCSQQYGIDHPCKTSAVRNKIEITNLAKYGTKCSLQAKEIRKNIVQQNIEKYGVECHLSAKEIKDKIRQTNLEKYGVECVLKNDAIKDKIRQTNLEKYGVENPAQFPSIKDRIRQTNLEKYGVENVLQSQEIRNKIRQTNLEKYGVENGGGSAQAIEKIKQTTLNNYGIEYGFLNAKSRENSKKTKRIKAYFNNVITDIDEPLFTLEYFIDNYSTDLTFEFKCRKCKNVFSSKHYDGRHSRCPICYQTAQKSIPEIELSEFIEQYITAIKNSRKIIPPLELDIYIPEKKLAIEYDGLYWHSDDEGNNKMYHLNKLEECKKQKIQLIHVFENEWINTPNIVKSRLKNLLGIYDATIFARKCEVKIVDLNASKMFLSINHIQGAINSKINLGLFYDEELISLMSFGKCRFDKKHEWELLRFCNKLGYHIPGAAGKLLKHFERNYNPKSLVSYADRRWSQGKLYEALGFQLDHISEPNYWYFKSKSIESRIKYQKHKLKNILANFDETKTEVENMIANGYHRIFDCGNLVFEKIY